MEDDELEEIFFSILLPVVISVVITLIWKKYIG